MKRPLFLVPLAALVALSSTGPAQAVPGGKLRTLLRGHWTCELPGDATVLPTPRPEADFTAIPDSSYRAPNGERGVYLLLGSALTLTTGPFAGRRFTLQSEGQIRELDAQGAETGLRCVQAGRPAGAPVKPAEDTAL